MTEKDLFKYCKSGELDKIKQIIEKEDVQLNTRDKWDSTPLYYACLCGHLEIVEFLLENGARCDANTFDGERCLYGALTDQIRNVLKNFKINTTKLDQYDLHLERLFELGIYSDITFEIKERLFKAHKFILSARSEYFRLKFENKWKKRSYILGEHEEIIPEAFESILKYIYTGRFSTLKTYFKSCLRLAKLFKLTELIQRFNKELFLLNIVDNDLKLIEFDTTKDYDENKLVHETDLFVFGKFGPNTKLSTTISIISQEKVAIDFKKMAYYCLPESLRHNFKVSNSIDFSKIIDVTHDMTLVLEDDLNFLCHQAFVAGRCEYFKAFLNDPFNELKSERVEKQVPKINLKEVTKEVLVEIVSFIYSDQFSKNKLDEYILNEVLIIADLYMLTSLKRKCASELTQHLNNENVLNLLKISRLFDLKKLEFSCIHFLALYLYDFEESLELRELIIEDARKLKQRQETDTIDIIDDLRYAINENSSYYSNNKNLNDRIIDRDIKLGLLDKILSELNLVC